MKTVKEQIIETILNDAKENRKRANETKNKNSAKWFIAQAIQSERIAKEIDETKYEGE